MRVLHREIFVPNIIHKHGLLPCIAQCFQSCLIFILALFIQSFLKFSLEINSFFLVLKRVLRRRALKIQYGGQGAGTKWQRLKGLKGLGNRVYKLK